MSHIRADIRVVIHIELFRKKKKNEKKEEHARQRKKRASAHASKRERESELFATRPGYTPVVPR
jgi:hypothetical protein